MLNTFMDNNVKFLEFLTTQSPEEIAALDVQAIYTHLEEISVCLKKAKEVFEQALHLKFDPIVEKSLIEDGRTSGRVRLEEGWIAEKTKKVSWDQEKLWHIVDCLNLEERARFVKTSHTIEERKFAAWDETIRDLFMPARHVEFGKIKYSIIG